MSNEWTTELPTPKIETRYWFYGWTHGKIGADYQDKLPRLILLECIPLKGKQEGCTYIASGHFFYDSEAIGLFKKFDGVDTPSIDEFKKMIGI